MRLGCPRRPCHRGQWPVLEAPGPASAASARDAARAAAGSASTRGLDHRRDTLVRHGHGDVPGRGEHLGRRRRHGRPVPDLGEHLDVVPLVADRQRRTQRDAQASREPTDRAALRDAGLDELEEAGMADRHGRTPGECCRRDRRDVRRERRLADGQDLRDRMRGSPQRVGDDVRVGAHERRVVVREGRRPGRRTARGD